MRISRLFLMTLSAVLIESGTCRAFTAAEAHDLIAAARNEGGINFHAPTALGPRAAQELGTAFSRKYGFNINVNYMPTKGFTADVAKVISQATMGLSPEWDLMVLTENLHADLSQRGLHLPYDYEALGVDRKSIMHDKGSVAIVHGVVLPTYNSSAVSSRDVPGKWEDLLQPKWKDGRLGVSDATYLFALLATGPWGEEKTTEYVRGLAGQRPFLGRMAEVYTRVELREVLIAAMLPDNFIHRAKMAGAPIVHAERVEPVLILPYNVGVLKGAAHPNLARLFTAFLVTSEAQSIWDRYSGQTSALVPGTRTYNVLKGKETVFMSGQNHARVKSLTKEYSRILGFTR